MNRGQLKTRVSRVLGISLGTSDDQVDETLFLEELANEAVTDILGRTRVHVRSANAALTNGIAEYDLTAKMLRVITLKRNGETLDEQPRDQLTPTGYAFAGFNRLLLGSPAGANEALFVWYTPLPDPLATDTDDPALENFGGIPLVHHRAITDYMCWHAADKAGDTQAGRGERYRILYEGQDGLGSGGCDLGRIKNDVSRRGGLNSIKRHREVLRGDVDPAYWVG